MRVIVATVRTPFISGGAEVLAGGLIKALVAEGHEAELVEVPFNPGAPKHIPDQMLACRLLELREVHEVPVDRLIALKFPAYLIPHPHKVVWLLHQHRAAYDLWDHSLGGLKIAPNGRIVRGIIQRADRQIAEEAKGIFTISRNVTQRLRHYSQIDSTPLYHPPAEAGAFYCAEEVEDYFFFPSRLNPMKRQELVLRALAVTHHPVRVRFSGFADSPMFGDKLRRIARELRVEGRVEWAGFLSQAQKTEAYARALGVLFPPLDEDYGYVTLEAMLASKPVIACDDSGGPLEFILPGKTGLVTAAKAPSLARAMDALWEDRELARRYGREARRHYDQLGLSWSNVVRTLLA
jgi:glycosyltransferase involved in cell wall biosynthesis